MGFLDLLRPKFGKKGPPPPPPVPKATVPTAEPRMTAPAAATIAKAATRTYTVRAGDTLSAIAKRELGDQGKYMVIFEANREILKDPDKIFPGQVLKIPDTSALH